MSAVGDTVGCDRRIGAPIDDDRLGCLLALAILPDVGPATLLRCLADAELVRTWSEVAAGRAHRVPALVAALGHRPWEASAALAQVAAVVEPSVELARNRAGGRRVLAYGTAGYPSRLIDDPAPPAILFAQGALDMLDGPVVAVVGTRNATRAGRELAIELGADLAEAGVSVVSGLALGIDGAVHAGLLDATAPDSDGGCLVDDVVVPSPVAAGASAPPVGLGRPVGVVASGLDIAYPRRHAALHRRVTRHGCLLSETPLGLRPLPWRFPARNRIIAGLADALVVVESRSKGGSMVTAAEALLRDCTVLAVPGHPSAPAAAGTNDLLYDGATPLRDVGDVLVAIGRGGSEGAARRVEAQGPVDANQRDVLQALGVAPLTLDEVVARSGLVLETASQVLAEMELDGMVRRSGSWFERSTPVPGGPRRSAIRHGATRTTNPGDGVAQ